MALHQENMLYSTLGQFQREYRLMRLLFLLLVVICVACAGALVVTPGWGGITTDTKLTPPTIIYADGQCDATPQDVPYIALDPKDSSQVLPVAWSQAGKTVQDFKNAQACAAAFILYYQTFDISNPKTLESATYMLSASAKKHFYEGSIGGKSSIHMHSAWRAQLTQRQQIQQAHVGYPKFVSMQFKNGQLEVSLLITYRLSEVLNGQPKMQDGLQTITVGTIAPDTHTNGTGWQVTDWTENEVS